VNISAGFVESADTCIRYARKDKGIHKKPYGQSKMVIEMGSLFKDIPPELPEEIFDTICATDSVKIERIVSRQHASPEGFWYDQDRNEFVLVVKGSAGLKLEGEDDLVVLKTGDYMNIGSHVKHRIEWTDASCDTIWLSVYY
jgi:cupin 2 domain-containing protein